MKISKCHCCGADEDKMEVVKEGYVSDVVFYVFCRECMSRGPQEMTLELAVNSYNNAAIIKSKNGDILKLRDCVRLMLRFFTIERAKTTFCLRSPKLPHKDHVVMKGIEKRFSHYEA